MLKKDKKGFTLAELLIVVAIIGVLVAIAVPLFVGALSKAEDGVKTANERSLKGMAVIAIMSDDELLYDTKATDEKKGTAFDQWVVTGKYNKENDTLSISTITGYHTSDSFTPGSSAKTDDGYDLVVVITASDLTVPA